MKTYDLFQTHSGSQTGDGEMRETKGRDWVKVSDLECLEWAEKNVSKIVAMNDDNGPWWQVCHNLDHTSGKTLMEALENAMRKP